MADAAVGIAAAIGRATARPKRIGVLRLSAFDMLIPHVGG
jgi:hypothetical protein